MLCVPYPDFRGFFYPLGDKNHYKKNPQNFSSCGISALLAISPLKFFWKQSSSQFFNSHLLSHWLPPIQIQSLKMYYDPGIVEFAECIALNNTDTFLCFRKLTS